jgi:hypothetical protein
VLVGVRREYCTNSTPRKEQVRSDRATTVGADTAGAVAVS